MKFHNPTQFPKWTPNGFSKGTREGYPVRKFAEVFKVTQNQICRWILEETLAGIPTGVFEATPAVISAETLRGAPGEIPWRRNSLWKTQTNFQKIKNKEEFVKGISEGCQGGISEEILKTRIGRTTVGTSYSGIRRRFSGLYQRVHIYYGGHWILTPMSNIENQLNGITREFAPRYSLLYLSPATTNHSVPENRILVGSLFFLWHFALLDVIIRLLGSDASNKLPGIVW